MTETNVTTLRINYLSQEQYDEALEDNLINANELYFTPSVPISTITLNGETVNNPSFYAPLTAGGAGSYLISSGVGQSPTWTDLPIGSTSQAGILQLTNSISSTSTTTAATPSSVKSAYDLASAAMPKSGGTFTGEVKAANSASSGSNLYTAANLKNIVLSTSAASSPTSYPTGTIWIQYIN